MALDCSVMEKKPLVKDLLLNQLGKEHPARVLSTQGTPRSTRKILPRLNLCTCWNLLVSIMGRIAAGSFVCFRAGSKTHFQF
jgi:hypothetical protein